MQHRNRTGIESTDTLINKLMRSKPPVFSSEVLSTHCLCLVTIQTGLLTSLWAISDLVVYLLVVRIRRSQPTTSKPPPDSSLPSLSQALPTSSSTSRSRSCTQYPSSRRSSLAPRGKTSPVRARAVGADPHATVRACAWMSSAAAPTVSAS